MKGVFELFDFIEDALNRLKELSSIDSKHQEIIAPLETLLLNLNEEFLSFEKSHNEIIKHLNSEELKEQKIIGSKIQNLIQENLQKKQNLVSKLENYEKDYQEELSQLTNQTQKDIDLLQQELDEYTEELNHSNDESEKTKDKELASIEVLISKVRKSHAQAITRLEKVFNDRVKEIEETFKHEEKRIQNESIEYEEKIKDRIEQIHVAKNAYREQSDEKYLSIKNEQQVASVAFNRKVDKINKITQEKIKKLDEKLKNDITPFEEQLTIVENTYINQKELLEAEFESLKNSHKVLHQQIINNFNEKKDLLTKEISDENSILNSKLSLFKETIQQERQERLKELNDAVKNASSADEEKQLKKSYKRFVNDQDNELKRQISRTERQLHENQRNHYLKLYEAEVKYLEQIKQWTIEDKFIFINHRLKTFDLNLQYEFNKKSLETEIKKLKLKHDHDVELTKIETTESIKPLEIDLSIAGAIAERDINLLSNETSYHLSHYEFKEYQLQYDLELFKLAQQERYEKAKLHLEYEKNKLSMITQLSIEKENTIRDKELRTLNLRKDLIMKSYELQNLIFDLDYTLKKSEIEAKIDYLLKRRQERKSHLQYILTLNNELTQMTIDFDNLQQNFEINKLNYILKENAHTKDLNIVHSRIHFLFNQIYVIYNIYHRFMVEMIRLYQLPADANTIKIYIQLYSEIFKNLSRIQEKAKDNFMLDMIEFHESKINDLTSQKMTQHQKMLKHEFDLKVADLDTEKEKIQLKISDIQKNIDELGKEVDLIQSEINKLELQSQHTQNKKEAKIYQTKIDHLTRKINTIENEMSALEEEIEKNQKPISKLNLTKSQLKKKLDQSIKTHRIEQSSDAKAYIKQVQFYKQVMKSLSHLIDTYEIKILSITDKLNQPIYLTNQIIKEYEKNFYKLGDYFEKNSHLLYQELLKGSMNLFNQLSLEQKDQLSFITKDLNQHKERFERESIRIKNQIRIHNERHLEHINEINDDEVYFIDLKQNQIKKDKNIQIETLRQQIKNLEQQLLLSDDKLKNELTLIDANLESVILELSNDYTRNLTRLNDSMNKQRQKLKDNFDAKNKFLKSLEQSTSLKNSNLSLRFQQTENKFKHQLKENLDLIKQQKDKNSLMLQKRHETVIQSLKSLKVQQERILSNEKTLSQQIGRKVERQEENRFKKNIKDLKRSHQYKLKQLNLS